MNIHELGWDAFFEAEFGKLEGTGLVPGRVVSESRHVYDVRGVRGVINARVSGHFRYVAVGRADYPTVGDWVALRAADDGTMVIEKVLDRKSSFSRRSAGKPVDEQVIAANIDLMCVVCALDGGRNFNLRGIERYLVMARKSGARPVLVLNKADLCEDTGDALLMARSVLKGISDNTPEMTVQSPEVPVYKPEIPVYIVSARNGDGMAEFSEIFRPRTTSAFTGPSGVGKSALINSLLGMEVQKTGDIREDDRRGRHTTTRKELFFLPSGGMVIDTPGLRELQAWGGESAVDDAFADIAEAAVGCRFRDCTHGDEPGCVVQEMLRTGRIEYERFQNFMVMKKELAYLNSRCDEKARMDKKRKDKELARRIKEFYRDRK